MRRRLLTLVLIGVVTSVAGTIIIRQLPGIHRLELLAYSWHVRAQPVAPADDRIVIVGMDDESLAHLPLERPAYPLPRTIHAQLLRELHTAGAKVVGFDVMFISEIPREDEILAEAMREQGSVFSGADPAVSFERGEERYRFNEVSPLLRPYVRQVSLLIKRELSALWFVPAAVDERTNKRYPHMTAALASAYLGSDLFMPGDESYIRFIGPPETFKPVPFHEVVSGEWRRTRGAELFKDKIVLVGSVQRFTDRHATPLGEMQGVEILAQETQSLLAAKWITHWSEAWNFFFRVTLCTILALATWRLGFRRALIIGLIEAGAWIIAAHEAFARNGAWLDTVEPVGTLAAALAVSSAYETGRMRRVFQRFMPSRIADEMLDASPDRATSTAEKEITIVFCDIRDSTRLGETLPSDQIDEMLRRYFVAGEEAALRLGTELDKFVGDEIMLFFEDRPGYEDHAIRGIRWALAIQESVREIGIRVGVGVSTGRARVGFVGAKQRIQHTVVGDAVNTASRLQSATKEVNRGIVVGESTWARAKDKFTGEDLGEITVKGKEKPIRIYCPVGILDA